MFRQEVGTVFFLDGSFTYSTQRKCPGRGHNPSPGVGGIVQRDRHCPRGDHPVLQEGRRWDTNLAMLLAKNTQMLAADSGQRLRPGSSRD